MISFLAPKQQATLKDVTKALDEELPTHVLLHDGSDEYELQRIRFTALALHQADPAHKWYMVDTRQSPGAARALHVPTVPCEVHYVHTGDKRHTVRNTVLSNVCMDKTPVNCHAVEQLKEEMPVVLFVHANWCRYCTNFIPTWNVVVAESTGPVHAAWVAVDEGTPQGREIIDCLNTIRRGLVRSFPTLLLWTKSGIETIDRARIGDLRDLLSHSVVRGPPSALFRL